MGEGLKSTPAVLMWLLTSSAYLLGWIIGDGGLYKPPCSLVGVNPPGESRRGKRGRGLRYLVAIG